MSTLNIGLGTYYGDGTYGSGSSYTGGYTSSRGITSSNIRTMTRNTAAGYAQDFEIIQKYLENGQIDKAMEKYNSLFEEVRASNSVNGQTLNDSQVSSIMSGAYSGVTGISMLDMIDEKTSSPFMSGLAQGIPIIGFFCEDMTTSEALAKMEGEKTSFADKFKEYAGAAASGAAVGFACGFNPVGALIGAGVGVAQTFLKDIF